jgi:hypothetical protein
MRVLGQRRSRSARDKSDAITVDYNHGVALHRIRAGIDDGDVGDDGLRWLKRSLRKGGGGEHEHKRNKRNDAVKMEDHAAEDTTGALGGINERYE